MADEKYIKMKDALDVFPTDYSHPHYSANHWWVQEQIKNLPIADVRPVVLCRKCANAIDGFICTIGQFGGKTFPNNFCSSGIQDNETAIS